MIDGRVRGRERGGKSEREEGGIERERKRERERERERGREKERDRERELFKASAVRPTDLQTKQ